MATTILGDGQAIGAAPQSPLRSADRGRFFIDYAVACLAIAVLGFLPSFWMPLGTLRYGDNGLVLVHGLIFTAWPLLFLWQTVQVERGRIVNHRAWGMVGVSLATMILLVGIATVESQLAQRIANGFGDRARAFAIVPLSNIALFFALFAAAVANVSRSDWHKRLMMCASAVMLVPPFARMIAVLVDGRPLGVRAGASPPGLPELVLRPASLVLVLMITAALIDRRRRYGSTHPAWLWGIGLFVAIAVGRIPVARTDAWYAVTEALVAFG